jgi:K+ transporter
VASIGTVFNRFIPKFWGYGVMTRNAVSAWEYFQIPPKRVVEFGTQVEL